MKGTVMAGESKSELIASVVAFHPENERANWAHWYRGWTKEALRRQRELHRAMAANRDIETVADLLDALDARGDDVSAAAAYLIRHIGATHPEVLDIENAEL